MILALALVPDLALLLQWYLSLLLSLILALAFALALAPAHAHALARDRDLARLAAGGLGHTEESGIFDNSFRVLEKEKRTQQKNCCSQNSPFFCYEAVT